MEEEDLLKKKILTGDDLENAIKNWKNDEVPLIDGFLNSDSILMIYADDGIGKSIVVLQAALQASAGVPVFGGLEVPNPLNVLYIVAERGNKEPVRRLKTMVENTGFDKYRLMLDSSLIGINLQREDELERAYNHILEAARYFEHNGGVQVVVIDPVYALSAGELTTDTGAGMVTNFTRKVQAALSCAIIIVHHTNRGGRDMMTGKRSKGDMYGNRFLSAHTTGHFQIEKNKDGSGVTLVRGKNSHENMLERIVLKYDKETCLSYMEKPELSKSELIAAYFRSCKTTGKKFTFNDIELALKGVSTQYLRRVVSRHLKNSELKVYKCNGKASLYEVVA